MLLCLCNSLSSWIEMKPLAGFPGSSNWLGMAGDAVDAATGLGSREESF